MKTKRRVNVVKLIKNWLPIIVIIIIVVMWCHKKEDSVIGRTTTEAMTSKNRNIMTVELQEPETGSKITDWNLILINKDNEIPEDYQVELQEVEGKHKVDRRIVEALKLMLSDARQQGLNPSICSSYRTTNMQTTLFNQKVSQYKSYGYTVQEAEEKASYWVTLPRTSEHEIGLAVDIVSANYQVLDERQEETAMQKWLLENCWNYGFILRYPTNKKEITKINYEPWHYRYVGIENAKFIRNKGFCLEEYIDYLKR